MAVGRRPATERHHSPLLIFRQAQDDEESAGGQEWSEPAGEEADPNSDGRPETNWLKLVPKSLQIEVAKLRRVKSVLCRKYSEDYIHSCHCAPSTTGEF